MRDVPGIVEWFCPGEHERVEQVLAQLATLGTRHLRTHISWAEYHAAGGQDWYDWLLDRLGRDVELLPCVLYTPPSLSRNGQTNGAPRVLKDYADFVDHLLTRHGRHFSHVELWNEPNNLLDWDWRGDPDCALFSEMIGNAAWWARRRGWKVVLPGLSPFDPKFLLLMGERGVLDLVDVVGLHGFPGTWDSETGNWSSWDDVVAEMQAILDRHRSAAEIWITETGYSTWRHDEIEQASRFLAAQAAPVPRMYWYGLRDVPAARAVQEGPWFDLRHYHLGLSTEAGRPKLLGRLLAEGGSDRVRNVVAAARPTVSSVGGGPHRLAIIGGAGFIGCNLADSVLSDGAPVTVIDNFARAGVEQNLDWLRRTHGDGIDVRAVDVRDAQALAAALGDASAVVHLAAQTAVTTSLKDPAHDFAVNAQGTFNVLEAVRRLGRRIPVVFASTNKVYGALADLAMCEEADRYVPEDEGFARLGVDERRPLEFCTPYGCSKGAADQYVLDYAASFGIPTVVLRMSCIYGPRQFGTEDQGWLAHFLIRALRSQPITVYGDGKQVRDVLHVSDAVDAYRRVLAGIDGLSGRAFNLGGGPENAISLRMLLATIAEVRGEMPLVAHEPWRQGDQAWFVADTGALRAATGWRPGTGWRDGVPALLDWLATHRVEPERIAYRVAQTA